MEKNDTANENIMNMLLEIQQDIKEIKEQVKDIDERLELVETHCVYEILNDEETLIHEWGRQWYTNRKQKSILEEKIEIVKKIKNIREEYNIEIEVPSWTEQYKRLKIERPRISTDSLIRTTNKQVEVLTNPEEIKQEVKNVFSHRITSQNIENLDQNQ
ncbi:2479_t:CDS:2, partial [Diversispora eburnea]